MQRRQITASIVALAAALVFATAALASGEPKNELPFTTAAAQSNSAPDWFERYAAAHPYGHNISTLSLSSAAGEPKNELPFTRLATRTAVVPDWFERYAAAHPYGANLAASTTTPAPSRGFRWRDALIGAAAGGTLALLCAAAFGVSRARRRHQLVHAIGA